MTRQQRSKAGKLSFELKGKKLKGVFALARMKGLPEEHRERMAADEEKR